MIANKYPISEVSCYFNILSARPRKFHFQVPEVKRIRSHINRTELATGFRMLFCSFMIRITCISNLRLGLKFANWVEGFNILIRLPILFRKSFGPSAFKHEG